MKTFVLLSEKRWHLDLYNRIVASSSDKWILINNKADFTEAFIEAMNPDKIFIPHWSYFIPAAIFNKCDCVVFHMTDLPYGRGGSPLQNLIVNGASSTKITAIKVTSGVDEGNIYLKRDLQLFGTAEEIFIRSAKVIEEMISTIISDNLTDYPQVGEVTIFTRRKPDEGDMSKLTTLEQVYDYIRMLDCEGYQQAYIESDFFKFEFNRATIKGDNSILANVRIIKK